MGGKSKDLQGASLQIDTARLSGALQHLYTATFDATCRAELPHRLSAAFDAPSCLMHIRDRDAVSVVGATENCSMVLPAYTERYHNVDAWSLGVMRRRNIALVGTEVVPEKELLQSEWYHEICRPIEIHQVVGCLFDIDKGACGLIGIHRPAGGGPFEVAERAMMQLLVPHLAQAMRMMRIANVDARAGRLGFDALTALSVGVFVVAGDSRVRLMNAAAERAAKAGRPVRVCNGRISLSDPKLDGRLRTAVRKASLAPLGRSLFAGETIVIPSGEGAGVPLMIVPLPPDTVTNGFTEPLAAIFIGEPSSNGRSSDLIRAMYGLTQAETRVLLSLLNGERLSDYAGKAGITINTAQTQLKSVFAKTGCHRQADLMRKIMGDPMLRLWN